MDAVAFAILGPLVILLSGYWLSGLFFVNPMQHTERWLMTVDDWLLRRSGILAAYQASPRIVSELVEAAYVLVYLVIPAGAATLVIGGHPDAINRFWATVLLAAFLSYGTMPWLRTRSPRVLEAAMGTMHPRSSVRRLNAAILDRASIQANTVPSGHAASAVATALAVVSVMPLAGSIFLALAGAIVIATVLGRYHYLVDSLLGIIVAVAAWQLCR
jgi:membrane-associated phospholipid phosphatase